MASFVIDLVPLKCQDSVLKKIINRNFRELLESGLEPYSLPLSDPEYTGNELFHGLVEFIYTDTTTAIYNKYTYEQIQQFLISCGVTPEHIVEWLKHLFATTRVIRATKIIFEDEKNHKTKKISKKVKESYSQNLNDYKTNFNISCTEVDENEECSENETLWAVRSKYGDYPVKFYKTNSGNNIEIRYVVRYQYAIDTLCNYYEVREILYNNWIELSDEYKNATIIKK